ncbi:MAG: stage II sporulation protein P [Oscillospiraceae bacterium]|nr:stage II sporulation protein P [Oscillospiraceae bacterium]
MKLWKFALFVLMLGVLLRGFVALGVDTALDAWLQTTVRDQALVEAALLNQSPLLMASAETLEVEEVFYEHRYTGDDPGEAPTEVPQIELPPADLPYRPQRPPTLTLTGTDREPNIDGIYVRNHTTYQIDVESLLNAPLPFRQTVETPTVLILHTHGTESFRPDGEDWYENTDNYRTNDKNLNITRVGREIAAIFESRGITVLHNQYLHDYPSFRGSYGRSLETARRYLNAYPEIQIIFDIHRDAIMDAAGQYIRTTAGIDGIDASQVMLVVGTDHAGLEHPHWRENFAFALRLQRAMLDRYPNLPRPIALREERFNAHLAPGAILVEIGTCANTLQEALAASRLFAEIAADVILGY